MIASEEVKAEAMYPANANEAYPAEIKCDFRRFKVSTLRRYINHHDLQVRPDANPEQLAIAVGKHFNESYEVSSDERTIILNFVESATGIPTAEFLNGSAEWKRANAEPVSAPTTQTKKRKRSTKTKKKTTQGSSSSSSSADSGQRRATSSSSSGSSSSAANASEPALTQKQITNGAIMKGQEVAAKVKGTWIHARVVKFVKKDKKYEVMDADTEAANQMKSFIVSPTHVIPLVIPRDSVPLMPVNTKVLALFPYTTSFYPACVVDHEAKGERYFVRFEDDYEDGTKIDRRSIPRYFVVKHPR